MKTDPEKLLSLYFNGNGSVTQEQVTELSEWINSSPENAERFVQVSIFHKSVHDYFASQDVQNRILRSAKSSLAGLSNDDSACEISFWDEWAKCEEDAPSIEVLKLKAEAESNDFADKAAGNKYEPGRLILIYNKIVSVAAVLLIIFIVYANIFPPQYSVPVATVEDQIEAKWSYESDKLNVNDRVLINQPPYMLEEGVVKLLYDDGVELIIEGPAEFVIEKKGVGLLRGHLFAHVPSSGVGFTVDTANIRFIDLGTDFCVYSEDNESAELHVLKGEVQYCTHFPDAQNSSKTIKENNARRFVAKTKDVQVIPVADDYFVRKIDSKADIIWRGQKVVDLADIAGGGNGFGTGRLNTVIEAKSGLMRIASRKELKLSERKGDGNYHQAKEIRYVDGIFVPDGPIQISSDGYVCTDFPDTSGLYSCDLLYGSLSLPDMPLVLGGIEYGTEQNHSLFMHSNLGVTFDLSKIRTDLNNAKIKEFQTRVGISDNANVIEGEDVDIWIIVDGKIAYQKSDVKRGQIENVSVMIPDYARFLTIAVTDSKLLDSIKEAYGILNEVSDISSDWCIIANPVLILE